MDASNGIWTPASQIQIPNEIRECGKPKVINTHKPSPSRHHFNGLFKPSNDGWCMALLTSFNLHDLGHIFLPAALFWFEFSIPLHEMISPTDPYIFRQFTSPPTIDTIV